jgi:hypothetical protein
MALVIGLNLRHRIRGLQMPPLIVVALGALGGTVLVRWALREAQRINHELEEARFAKVREAAPDERIQTLHRDPVTGVYRPD